MIVLHIHCEDGMQNDEYSDEVIAVNRPLVMRSLRRSKVRKRIAEYLFEISPSCSYTSEIAYNVRTTPTNVIGAIRGMGTRYKQEESLINLKIIEEKKTKTNVKLYGLTDFGKDILEKIDRRR